MPDILLLAFFKYLDKTQPMWLKQKVNKFFKIIFCK